MINSAFGVIFAVYFFSWFIALGDWYALMACLIFGVSVVRSFTFPSDGGPW